MEYTAEMKLVGDATIYRGKTPLTIARRLFGRSARIVRSADPNSPVWGQIVRWNAEAGGSDVLAAIVWCQWDRALDEIGSEAWQAE